MAIVLCCCNTSGQVNNWTKQQSGHWEEPFWSLGGLPAATHSAIQFTNAGFKALAINPSTRAQYPQTLTISNLVVSAPPNSGNLLLLNYSGLQVPLRVLNSFHLGPNGHLLTLYARLQVEGNDGGAFYISGPVMHAEFSEVLAGNVFIGCTGPGTYNLTNGLLSVNWMTVGSNAAGTFNQYGGTHRFNLLSMRNTEAGATSYNLYAGEVEGGALGIGLPPDFNVFGGFEATFSQSGGMLTLTDSVRVGLLGPGTSWFGTFILSNGILRAQATFVDAGGFFQYGGTNFCSGLGIDRRGRYVLEGGTLITRSVSMSPSEEGSANFTHLGGTHITDRLSLSGHSRGFSSYSLRGGSLTATSIDIVLSFFDHENGINTVAGDLTLSDGSYSLSGGWLNVSNISLSTLNGHFSSFGQYDGVCWIANDLRIGRRCWVALQSGILAARNVSIDLGATFGQRGGAIINRGTFTLDSAVFSTIGQPEPLGCLRISGGPPNPAIVMASNACAVSFVDSHNEPWQFGTSLEILGWKGSTNGGGYNQLVFGNSSAGLARHQLAQIVFNDPAGLPPGRYPARILDTGEVVPTHQPLLAFNALSRNFVLSWLDGFILQTATNVTGPYVDVPAFGLYTNPLTADPQRFFRLRRP